MFCFVSLTRYRGKPVVVVQRNINDRRPRRFLLTKAGCLAAGRYIHAKGYASWRNSSVDFPEDICRFRYDVRTLLSEGYGRAAALANKPRKAVIRKIFAHCSLPAFQHRLSPAERLIFQTLRLESCPPR